MERLNQHTTAQVVEAISYWASHHPFPDDVVLEIGGEGEYSPHEIAEAVKKQTPPGQFFLRVIDEALERHSLEEILHGFGSMELRAR